MALLPDRQIDKYDNSFFCNDTTASRGGPICLSTAGSGAAMDQAEAVASYVADPSGKYPIGVLLQDVVNLDLTRQHINWHKNEVQTGSKVDIAEQGFVVTDRIYTGQTPAAGRPAYVGPSGYLVTTETSNRNPYFGRFKSTKDEDGYVKVEFNLPTQVTAETFPA